MLGLPMGPQCPLALAQGVPLGKPAEGLAHRSPVSARHLSTMFTVRLCHLPRNTILELDGQHELSTTPHRLTRDVNQSRNIKHKQTGEGC